MFPDEPYGEVQKSRQDVTGVRDISSYDGALHTYKLPVQEACHASVVGVGFVAEESTRMKVEAETDFFWQSEACRATFPPAPYKLRPLPRLQMSRLGVWRARECCTHVTEVWLFACGAHLISSPVIPLCSYQAGSW